MRVFDKAHPIIIAGQGGLWQGSIALGDRYRHTFGGPLDLSVRGFPTNRRPLHRLLKLDLRDSRLNISLPGATMLHLLYGFAYDCCLLDYQVVSDSEVRVIEMTPRRPTRNWPYEDYPEHFAVRPVALRDRKPISDKNMTARAHGSSVNIPCLKPSRRASRGRGRRVGIIREAALWPPLTMTCTPTLCWHRPVPTGCLSGSARGMGAARWPSTRGRSAARSRSRSSSRYGLGAGHRWRSCRD
jgi:hypothetical protein